MIAASEAGIELTRTYASTVTAVVRRPETAVFAMSMPSEPPENLRANPARPSTTVVPTATPSCAGEEPSKSNRLPEVPRVSRSSHVSGDAAFVTLKYAPISDGARPRSQMRTSSIPPLNRSRLAAAYRPIASQYPLDDKGRPVRIRGTSKAPLM